MTATPAAFAHPDTFVRRHNGPRPAEAAEMLKFLGYESLDALIDALVPADIRLAAPLNIPAALSEFDALRQLRVMASKNQVFKSYLGLGYHDCITPPVIQRNILENPGWYTQYTPYQAEISQGRLESLLNFQTMVCDLTGLDIANASMLDESTAAAEAMTLCHRAMPPNDNRAKFFVSEACHPQTIALVRTRAEALKLEVIVGNHETFAFDNSVFGALVQYPTTTGSVLDYSDFTAKAHAAGALVVVAADILALTVLRAPGEFGADVCVGSAQRFGVPLGYGGPHAAFFATRDAYKRNMPGRLVGVSKDARGKVGLRLSLGTREQHIRREKATSNICTAQALLANIAAMYAVYHGPAGLAAIATRVHRHTRLLAAGVAKLGHALVGQASRLPDGRLAREGSQLGLTTGETGGTPVRLAGGTPAPLPGATLAPAFFDTIAIQLKGYTSKEIVAIAEKHGVNLRVLDKATLGVALDETTDLADVELLVRIFNAGFELPFKLEELHTQAAAVDFGPHARTSKFLTAPVFNRHHSETELLRYLRKLESRDLSLCQAMIPLGSCTMKLNATSEMFPVTWPEFGKLHPFAPLKQTLGYQEMFKQLEQWLAEITGFAGVSLQPNSGSQGEYAGLLVIAKYLATNGQAHRDICLIPNSAHGTNPASAVMAGMKVVAVACDAQGNIDVADLRAKTAAHAANLACLMVTYPSTHGVFEGTIREICQIIHDAGGQVYMDGANMNAQVGLTSPGFIGADVCHLNLHKTFCIPHGGGGPGMGPIGVAEHLVDFLPDHPVVPLGGEDPIGPVSAAPWGSASILPISWVYIACMGGAGLTEATKVAILNANYISRRLEKYFPTLYKGTGGLVAHECILDLRGFKATTAEDVAKRLMDFSFHAPTLSWPVAGTLMVEPTESEPKCELDRFCDAMIAIHGEMIAVETGKADKANNPLKGAPHTADQIAGDWQRPYTREQAAFPVKSLVDYKFWPPVARVDNVFGDRNLVCSCVGMENYQ